LTSMPESVNRRGSSGPTIGAIVRFSGRVAIVGRGYPRPAGYPRQMAMGAG
jgi:hypothetical protein